MGWKYLCLEAELPTSITGRDQVAHVRNPRRSYGSGRVAQLNSSDDTMFRTAKSLSQDLQMTRGTREGGGGVFPSQGESSRVTPKLSWEHRV